MKHIVYSVGSTGARAIVQFKTFLSATESKEYIFRAFDMDVSTKNIGLTDEELCLVQENDFRGALKNIINSRRSQSTTYDKINAIVPLTNVTYVNTRPATKGVGACKDPSVSSVAGQLNQETIHNQIEKDTNKVAAHTDKGERYAYLLLSPCGGTSTGLHLKVLEKLIQKDFTVFLFFLSPSYFMRVQTDSEGVLKANTLATLLRVAFDKAQGNINYLETKPQTGNVYPFIVESDWENARFAELDIKNGLPDRERFCKYVALTLFAFIQNQFNPTAHNRSEQPWLSSYINDEIAVSEKQEFFNTILLYPQLGMLKAATSDLLQKLTQTNGKTAEENLTTLLQPLKINNAQSGITNKPEVVLSVVKEAIHNQTLPAGSIREILVYISQITERNRI